MADEEDFAPRVGRSIRLMTYNIHNGIGRDRIYDLRRIEAVIRSEAPDIVALQEVDRGMARSRFDDQARLLGEALGMYAVHCITLEKERGGFGNALLSRFPLLLNRRYDLTHPAGRAALLPARRRGPGPGRDSARLQLPPGAGHARAPLATAPDAQRRHPAQSRP
jgi:endonuclease/exonuclease/phosphatase family metal-dependent hydrolase